MLKSHTPGTTNYLMRTNPKLKELSIAETRIFPANPAYRSESILSEELRTEIYNRVVKQKKSVRAVSVELKVDMRRVAAVVRLVELEKRMEKQVCLQILSTHYQYGFPPTLLAFQSGHTYGAMMRKIINSISLYDPVDWEWLQRLFS